MRSRWMLMICLLGMLGACGKSDSSASPTATHTTSAAYPTARPQPTHDLPTSRPTPTTLVSATPSLANTQPVSIPACQFDPNAAPPLPSGRTVDDWSFGEPKVVIEELFRTKEQYFALRQWLPDNQRILYTIDDTDRMIQTIDRTNNHVESYGSTKDSSIPPFWNASAKGVMYRNDQDSELRLSLGANKAQSAMVRHTATFFQPQFSPSGRFITVFDEQPSTSTFYEYALTGYREVAAPTVNTPFTPLWVWNDQEDRVLRIGEGQYLMTMATSEVCSFAIPREMGQRQETIRRAVWSPNGHKIALLVSNDPQQYGLSHLDLKVLDVETGELTLYPVESSYVMEVVWLDNQFILAGIDNPASTYATYSLVLIDILTQQQKPILSEYMFDLTTYPSSLIVAPNRKALAMQRFDKQTQITRLYVVEIQ